LSVILGGNIKPLDIACCTQDDETVPGYYDSCVQYTILSYLVKARNNELVISNAVGVVGAHSARNKTTKSRKQLSYREESPNFGNR